MSSRESQTENGVEQEPSSIPYIEIPAQDGYSQTEDGFLVSALGELGLLSPKYLYAPFSQEQFELFLETGNLQEFFEDTIDCYQYNDSPNNPALVDVISDRGAQGIVEYLNTGGNYVAYIAVYDRKYLRHSHDVAYQFFNPHITSEPESLEMVKRAAFLGIVKVTLLDH